LIYGEENTDPDLGYDSDIKNTDAYTVLVDGIEYYSSNSQDETKTRMIFEYNNYVNKFVFSKYYTMTDEMADLVSSFN
jgi:saccharopine dehydrogenase-like NADP-dependent oxidoreductase